jgi:hypothetical protein
MRLPDIDDQHRAVGQPGPYGRDIEIMHQQTLAPAQSSSLTR